jgi:hypothetical protein
MARSDRRKRSALELKLVDEGGVKVLEGVPGEQWLTRPEEVGRLVEACFSTDSRGALLYVENLTPAFFDLSSGEAGAVLQKLRNYGIRLAIVSSPGSVAFSSRFGEMVAEERRRDDFGLFDTRVEGREWFANARSDHPDETR